MNITIVGAGAMGTALSIPLASNRANRVSLCGTEFDNELIEKLRQGDAHPSLGSRIPESVWIRDADGLARAVKEADIIILAVNSNGLLPTFDRILPDLRDAVPVVVVTKGLIELEDQALPPAAALRKRMRTEGFGTTPPLACLAGPSIASEIARKVPTIVRIAANDMDTAQSMAEAFSTGSFHCHYSSDLEGTEICAAYKNIYTIALSWPAGLREVDKLGDQTNLKAILFLQTIHEIKKLIAASQGEPDTAYGAAGIGDLVTTSDSGRNGRFGKLLGSGRSVSDALNTMADSGIRTIEGYEAVTPGVRCAEALVASVPTELPLLHGIQKAVRSKSTVREVIDSFDLSKMAT